MAEAESQFEPRIVPSTLPYDEIIAGLLAAAAELRGAHPYEALLVDKVIARLARRGAQIRTEYELGRRDGESDRRARRPRIGVQLRKAYNKEYCDAYDVAYAAA